MPPYVFRGSPCHAHLDGYTCHDLDPKPTDLSDLDTIHVYLVLVAKGPAPNSQQTG
jgi:hypothetical protein